MAFQGRTTQRLEAPGKAKRIIKGKRSYNYRVLNFFQRVRVGEGGKGGGTMINDPFIHVFALMTTVTLS